LLEKNRFHWRQAQKNRMQPTVAVTCIVCGKVVVANNLRKRYCKNCLKKINNEAWKKNWRETREVTVAVTCAVCDELILTTSKNRRYCSGCKGKIYNHIPRKRMKKILQTPAYVPLEPDNEIWKKIHKIRKSEGFEKRRDIEDEAMRIKS